MFESDAIAVDQRARTGTLPPAAEVDALLQEAHRRYAGIDDGELADYIPDLALADPAHFALALTGVNGATFETGDVGVAFTIQSISKAFVLALVCEEIGHQEVHRRVGVNNSGLPFNSVIAVELNGGNPMNPMVNAGAIATTALVPAADSEGRWHRIRDGLSRFAGRELELDEGVLASELRTNGRNRAIAKLLDSYSALGPDPLETVDVYTRQCSLLVTAHDLAVMGSTLANGGVNAVTGEQVVSAGVARDVLSVLASCGMYERSGEWLFEIGFPAKSGVSGGIVAISPGKGALGTYSPRLDPAGNSVRGQRAAAFLSRALGLSLLASAPWDPIG
ncbi:glutaminase A [Brachybacterium sp. DNPG3]